MVRSISPKQAQVLSIIRTSILSTGHPPSLREIEAVYGRCPESVLDRLAAKGVIVRNAKHRGIRIVGEQKASAA